MAFLLEDDFERPALGSDYIAPVYNVIGYETEPAEIVAGALQCPLTTGSTSYAVAVVDSALVAPSLDQYIEVTLRDPLEGADHIVELLVGAGADSYYGLLCVSGQAYFVRSVPGTYDSRMEEALVTLEVGDILALVRHGSELKFYRNGALVLSYIDPAPLPAGSVGIILNRYFGSDSIKVEGLKAGWGVYLPEYESVPYFTDDFERTALGSDYDALGVSSAFEIVSGKLSPDISNIASSYSKMRLVPEVYSPKIDQWLEVTIAAISPTHPKARLFFEDNISDKLVFYFCDITGGSLEIWKYDRVVSEAKASATVTVAPGDVVAFERVGNLLKVYLNDIEAVSYVDPDPLPVLQATLSIQGATDITPTQHEALRAGAGAYPGAGVDPYHTTLLGNVTEYLIEDLDPASPYEFRLKAGDGTDESEYSEWFPVSTLAADGPRLSGIISAASNSAGRLTLDQFLSGVVAAASASQGRADLDLGLSGTASATSALSGILDIVAAMVLSGSVNATSASAGKLGVESYLRGKIAAESGTAGAFGLIQGIWGTVAAQSALSGQLTLLAEMLLAGVSAVQSTTTGKLSLDLGLVGTVQASTSAVGALWLELMLSGQVTAASHLEGLLSGAVTVNHRYLVLDAIKIRAALGASIELKSALSAIIQVNPKD